MVLLLRRLKKQYCNVAKKWTLLISNYLLHLKTHIAKIGRMTQILQTGLISGGYGYSVLLEMSPFDPWKWEELFTSATVPNKKATIR